MSLVTTLNTVFLLLLRVRCYSLCRTFQKVRNTCMQSNSKAFLVLQLREACSGEVGTFRCMWAAHFRERLLIRLTRGHGTSKKPGAVQSHEEFENVVSFVSDCWERQDGKVREEQAGKCLLLKSKMCLKI